MLGKKLILLAASMFSLTLVGCSSSGSGGDQAGGDAPAGTAVNPVTGKTVTLGVDPVSGVARVGTFACINCHEDFTASAEKVSQFLQGKHVIHSAGITAKSGADCLTCHDPIGDGSLTQTSLQAFLAANPAIAAANPNAIPADGLAAVGCEACHGAGGNHYGAAMTEANARPDYTVCGKCHNAGMPHQAENPLGGSILENYNLSGHKQSIATAGATPAAIDALCSRCHSDEGFRKYVPLTPGFDANQLEAELGGEPQLTNVNPVQCRTCHDPHSGQLRSKASSLMVDADANPGTAAVAKVTFSASFNLCTTCHMNFLTPTWDVASQRFTYQLDPAKTLQHGGGLGGIPHFDDPTSVAIEGFNINAADDKACLNCHDAHGATLFAGAQALAEGWGQQDGFHGDYQSEPFSHAFSATDSRCMKCHNGTEAVKVLKGVADTALDASQGARVVGCVTCHDLTAKNPAGDAFALGARRARTDTNGALQANFTFPSGTTVAIANGGVGDNVLCLTCHSGRESMVSVDTAIAASAGPYSFINIHYRAAGATLFGNMAKGAYEFSGKSYASKFEHVESKDLCIECHNPHTGRLDINGPNGCNTCHLNIVTDPNVNYAGALNEVRAIRMAASFADYDGDADTAEGIFAEVEGMKALLLAAIQNYAATTIGEPIQYDANTYPYFFKAGVINFGNRYTAMDATLLKAAYNYQFSQKDPGVYAHNPSYVIEILFDSIEALGGDVSGLTRDDGGHFDAAGMPFRDWDGDPQVPTTCSKCHSSEGAAYFLDNASLLANYTRKYTMGKSSGLACESCHQAPFQGAAASPARRQPAQVAFPSGVVLTAAEAPAFFANDSKLCMTCHQGRASKGDVDLKIAAGPGANGTFSFTNIHYFAAAASFFGNEVHGGYEYTGKVYAGRMTFGFHELLGSPYVTCAGCHTSGAPSHDFKPLVGDCSLCHGFSGPGTEFQDLGTLNDNFNNIQTLKDQLLALITGSGVTVLPGYPYFSNITTPAQLKACYNWQVADKEPCGYIHNPDYILQLLFDAIDDLSNGAVVPLVARP